MLIVMIERGISMAKCDVCGKGVTFGKKYSHSHIRTNRQWKPNTQSVKVVVNGVRTDKRLHQVLAFQQGAKSTLTFYR